ncbi:MAG TPA: STAS domain-containing protein, partial [Micromonosporaceae bacterium]|nr:STAS domain-containing protein [Micromonosporaceae bacterium]
MTGVPALLEIDRTLHEGATVVRPHGELNLATYSHLRDALLKSALELPRAVVVDMEGLRVPTDSALVVFSSVCVQVSGWPAVPIVLVATRKLDRLRLRKNSVSRFVPVFASIGEALGGLTTPPHRRRTLIELTHSAASVGVARQFVEETCHRWGSPGLLPDAVLIASELVENAVRHTGSEPRLRLEQGESTLTVAVYDDDDTLVRMVEPDLTTAVQLGLVLVDKLAHTWSCAPMLSGGKVVWAVLR